MKPSSLSWLLSVNSTANQMNVASTSPSCRMSSSVSTPDARRPPRPRNATAVESSPSVAADAQSETMPANATITTFSSRVSGPSAASARRAAAGASGVDVSSGAMIRYSTSGISTMPASVGTDAASSQDPNPISTPKPFAISAPIGLAAIAVSHSAEERLRLTMPENIRKLPRRWRLLVAGLRAGRVGQRKREREDDAGARRVARKRRRDEAVHEEDAVRQSQRRSAEAADEQMADPRAETALHDRSRHQKGQHDEENRAVGKPGIRLRRREQAGQHRGGNGKDGRRQNRQGVGHDEDDGAGEDGEEPPRLNRQPLRRRREPHRRGSTARNHGGHDEGSPPAGGVRHGVAFRSRPRRSTERPWTTSSASWATYCHVNA